LPLKRDHTKSSPKFYTTAYTAVQHYQARFQSGKSTTDQLFALGQILEKCYEFNITTHHLFIDFKAAYDTIIRSLRWYVRATTSLQNERLLPKQRSLLRRAASKYKMTVPNPLKPDKD
jgi:hypothetical protein